MLIVKRCFRFVLFFYLSLVSTRYKKYIIIHMHNIIILSRLDYRMRVQSSHTNNIARTTAYRRRRIVESYEIRARKRFTLVRNPRKRRFIKKFPSTPLNLWRITGSLKSSDTHSTIVLKSAFSGLEFRNVLSGPESCTVCKRATQD